MASVRRRAPSRRASAPGTGSAKKIQTCPPLPERERSTAAGTCLDRQASRNVLTSCCHVSLSKSAARNQHVPSASIGRYTYAATVPMHGRPSWPIRLNIGRLAILPRAWLIPRRGTIDSPTRLLPRSEPYRCTREKNLSCLWPCPSHAELAGRLRYAGHPAWSRNRRCTNILPAPVDGGRSGPPATR